LINSLLLIVLNLLMFFGGLTLLLKILVLIKADH
jgi:hypothetical protein